jgi:hypothetical protein
VAGNQREAQRKNRRAEKDRRNKRIIWIAIAVVVLILAVMKIFEINVNSVKDYFTDSDGKFTITDRVIDDNFPYNLDSAQTLSFDAVNNKLGILTPNSFTVIDNKDAGTEYAFDHGYSNPVMSSSGIYTLVYDQGSKNMRLDTTSSSVYENTLENSIYCAAVAKNGSVVYATVSSEKKSAVTVVTKSLKRQLFYETSDGYVVAAAINNSGSKIAFALVNSESAQLKFTVYTMNVGSNEVKKEIELPAGNLLALRYSSNNIFVIGDSYLGVIPGQKKYHPVIEAGNMSTICYTFSPSGDLLIVYGDYNKSSENTLARVSASGRVRRETKISSAVKCVSCSSSLVSVLTNSSIITCNLSNLENKGNMKTDDSSKAICQMGSQVYIHRQSVIEKSEAVSK